MPQIKDIQLLGLTVSLPLYHRCQATFTSAVAKGSFIDSCSVSAPLWLRDHPNYCLNAQAARAVLLTAWELASCGLDRTHDTGRAHIPTSFRRPVQHCQTLRVL